MMMMLLLLLMVQIPSRCYCITVVDDANRDDAATSSNGYGRSRLITKFLETSRRAAIEVAEDGERRSRGRVRCDDGDAMAMAMVKVVCRAARMSVGDRKKEGKRMPQQTARMEEMMLIAPGVFSVMLLDVMLVRWDKGGWEFPVYHPMIYIMRLTYLLLRSFQAVEQVA